VFLAARVFLGTLHLGYFLIGDLNVFFSPPFPFHFCSRVFFPPPFISLRPVDTYGQRPGHSRFPPSLAAANPPGFSSSCPPLCRPGLIFFEFPFPHVCSFFCVQAFLHPNGVSTFPSFFSFFFASCTWSFFFMGFFYAPPAATAGSIGRLPFFESPPSLSSVHLSPICTPPPLFGTFNPWQEDLFHRFPPLHKFLSDRLFPLPPFCPSNGSEGNPGSGHVRPYRYQNRGNLLPVAVDGFLAPSLRDPPLRVPPPFC